MFLGPLCYGYALNCHLVYLAIPGKRPLCMKKQKLLVLIICNRKKVKFKFVQINMKHVSYTGIREIQTEFSTNILFSKMHKVV